MTERAHIAATHRDNRKQLAPDRPSTGSKKRNTKKWCKGKVGVEHKYEKCVRCWHIGAKIFKMTHDRCTQCGREEWR
jgi:hypothetical protein